MAMQGSAVLDPPAGRWTLLALLAAQLIQRAPVHGATLKGRLTSNVATLAARAVDSDAPQLTPDQFLMVSSPSQQKIVYTELNNFVSSDSVPHALIDSGLVKPRGLAFDRTRGYLYVADPGALSVFRYRVMLSTVDGETGLTTDGSRLTILQNRDVDWVACDINGDLFVTDKVKMYVARIPYSTISLIASGDASAGDVQFISEQELEAKEVKKIEATLLSASDDEEPSAPVCEAYCLYQTGMNGHVTMPSGIASDGVRIYWGNAYGGNINGSVVRGEVSPSLTLPTTYNASNRSNYTANTTNINEVFSFESTPLAFNINNTYGVAKSSKMVIFSTDINTSGVIQGYVYGVSDSPTGGTAVFTLASTMLSPRGLCWDGDQTVYVADEGSNKVWSIPVGRFADSVPISEAVSMIGPYDVALLSSNDDAWTVAAEAHSPGPGGAGLLLRLLALAAAAAAAAAPHA